MGVFLARGSGASANVCDDRDGLHVTLAHRDTAPASLVAVIGDALLGARVAVHATHRVTARWAAGAGTGALVTALVVDGLTTIGGADGCAARDLLPRVASGTPHVTLRVDGPTSNAAVGAALRLLAAHVGGPLPAAPATFDVLDVTFDVEPVDAHMAGFVATAE